MPWLLRLEPELPEPEPELALLPPEPEPEPELALLPPEPEPEPEPVLLLPEPEPEPEPVLLLPELVPEPEPVLLLPELVPEPEPVLLLPELVPELVLGALLPELEVLPVDPDIPPTLAYSGVAAIPRVNKAMAQSRDFLNFNMMIPLKVNKVITFWTSTIQNYLLQTVAPISCVIFSHTHLDFMWEFIPRQLLSRKFV